MPGDLKDGTGNPAPDSGAVEICANCGQRFAVSKGHDCLSMTADYMNSAEVAKVSGRAQEDSGLIGRVLGNDQYLVLERISQGGMGVVYKARHKQLGSLVAVKVLHQADDPSFQQRFLREAQLAAKVKHPNIVYISDFGVLPDGGSFLVMEYLEGKTLTQAMSGFRLEVGRALRVAVQLVRAILAAHEQGIIHRDLKPGNIFLVDKLGVPETVKIIDFGIAKGLPADGLGVPPSGAWTMGNQIEADKEDVHRTMSSLIGTPGFMAPEQIRSTLTDARTDQYAIGCILYQMLTGMQVFVSSTPQDLLLMHLVEPPEPPRKRLPELEISSELEDMVMRMLAKEPDDRFRSLEEVEAELALELSLYEGNSQPSQSSFRSSGQNALSLRGIPASQISSRGSHGSSRSGASDAVAPPALPPAKQIPRIPLIAGLALLSLGGVGLVYRALQPAPPVVAPEGSAELMQRLREKALAILSEQARHPDAQVRLGALFTLGQSREAQALPVLQGVYHGGSDVERAAALEAIGQLGERQAVPLLQVALREAGAVAVKAAAAQALIALGEESGVQFLEGELSRGEKSEQLHVALMLCARGHRAATEKLAALLEGSKPLDAKALSGLLCQARAGQKAARTELATRLAEAKSDGDKLRVASRLNQLGEVAGRQQIVELMARPGPEQLVAAQLLSSPNEPAQAQLFRRVLADSRSELVARKLALEGLGLSGQREDLRLIEPLLANKTPPQVRQGAAGAVLRILSRDEKIQSAHSLSWARAAVGDANWLVRHAAVPMIAENEAPDSPALLSQSLHDAKLEVRQRAARVLGKGHDVEALRSLMPALRDPERVVRRLSGQAVLQVAVNAQRSGSAAPEVTAWLRERLKSESVEEQVLARAALLRLGESAQQAELAKLVTSTNAEVRVLLAESTLDDKQLLETLLADREIEVRAAAAHKLAELSDRRGIAVLIEVLKRGGVDAVRAHGALLRLGESAGTPREIEDLQRVTELGVRLVLINDAQALPRPEAVALLTQAERDPEPFARRLVAEVAAELTQGGPDSPLLGVLTRLSRDPMILVSARAENLLERALTQNKPRPPAP